MTDYTYEQEWFSKHVTYWFELSNEMESNWDSLARTPDLPTFDAAFDETLNRAAEALNISFQTITDNVRHGAVAVREMGNLLLETGRAYGLTEEQAEELAGKVIADD